MRGKGALVKTLLVVVLASFLCKKANAWEMVLPSGAIMTVPEETQQSKQQKHYNWIEVDKNSGFQIAVECDAKEKEKCGKVYVDKDGDGKVDIEFLPSGAVLILPKGEERKGISKWIKLDEKRPYQVAFTCKSEKDCSVIYIDKNGDEKVDEKILPSGTVVALNNPQQPQKTKSESASVPQKHYNWIKPNKYRDWQCAYELIYNGNRPHGFKLYVDKDGDGKVDGEFKYNIMHIKPFFNGIRYRYELDWDQLRVGGGWREDLASALNVCGIEAMRKIFYLRGDTVSDPEDFEMGEPHLEKTYPSITFYK